MTLAALRFPILERIPIVGDLALSPHGLGIAVGFLVGAVMMMRRAEKRGLGHVYVVDIPETIQDLLVRAAIGAIIGARLFFVLTHLDQYTANPLEIFAIWEGGLTFLGGLAGAIIVALPSLWKQDFRPLQVLDSAAPGVAAGLLLGRLGDLMIGDHIGEPTDFFLGWRCTGNFWVRETNSFGFVDPVPYPAVPPGAEAPTAGCFDTVVHQTALYDFGAAALVLLLLLWFERSKRWDGFFTATWVYAYGALRFLGDFARQDRRLFGLTGSQYAVIGAIVALTVYLWWRKPWNERPWSWDLRFDHPWLRPPADATARDGDAADDGGAEEEDDDAAEGGGAATAEDDGPATDPAGRPPD